MRKKVGEYVLEELLGVGTYGQVYRSTKAMVPGKQYAIKMVSKKKMSEKSLSYLEREVDILRLIQDPNIVKLYDIKMTENYYYLIFEYCNGGDLSSFRKKLGGKVSEHAVRHILRQIVAGLDALYNNKTIHRDIKLGNILLHYESETARRNELPTVKIGDFGFARLLEKTALEVSIGEDAQPMSIVGTPLNMAPELLHKEAYSFKADIWSLGTLVYELLCGKTPFSGICKEELVRNVDTGLYWVPKDLDLSAECLDFLNACLQLKPSERIKWNKLLSHPFISGNEKTSFDFSQFKAMNARFGHFLQSSTHFIFNGKIRYTFGLDAETIKPLEKADDMKNLSVEEETQKEDILDEYVTVDKAIQESEAEDTDFTSAQLGSLNITDTYFY